MKLQAYVNFNGRCREAFAYYAEHLGARPLMMTTHSEWSNARTLPEDWQNAVMHARIAVGGGILMGADIPNAEPMRSAYLTLLFKDSAEAERAYDALKDGGQVLMPMEETFYAHRFAQVRDRFGINWMLMHEKPMEAA